MSDLIARFTALPSYGIGALVVLLLYAVQSEIRFGKRARTMRTGSADRKSTLAVSVAAAVSVIGFVFAMKANSPTAVTFLPRWFRNALLPGLPLTAWLGVILGTGGIALRLWAVLTLRERYSRTLLVQREHSIERGGPYRWVRHPFYGVVALWGLSMSLLTADWLLALLGLSVLAMLAIRTRIEEAKLTERFGDEYRGYARRTGRFLPLLRRPR